MSSIRQKGSVFAYILATIFLMGALILALTTGPQKSETSAQLDQLVDLAYGDISQIQAIVNECVLQHQAAVDINGDGLICSSITNPPLSAGSSCIGAATIDNPNPPYPVYSLGTTSGYAGGGTTAYGNDGAAGTTGINLDFKTNNIVCPGAPMSMSTPPLMFNFQGGRGLRLFGDTSTYTVNYLNNGTEGILMRITRTSSNPLWTEAISRLHGKFSSCQSYNVTSGGTCANGCFYFWLLRLHSSTIGAGGGCPP